MSGLGVLDPGWGENDIAGDSDDDLRVDISLLESPSSPGPPSGDQNVGRPADGSPSGAAPGARHEWTQFLDQNSMRPYWHNNKTGETRWEEPEGVEFNVDKSAANIVRGSGDGKATTGEEVFSIADSLLDMLPTRDSRDAKVEAGSRRTVGVREGFICPFCMSEMGGVRELEAHARVCSKNLDRQTPRVSPDQSPPAIATSPSGPGSAAKSTSAQSSARRSSIGDALKSIFGGAYPGASSSPHKPVPRSTGQQADKAEGYESEQKITYSSKSATPLRGSRLEAEVQAAVSAILATDVGTQLSLPDAGPDPVRWGINALLNDPSLVNEMFLVAPGTLTRGAFRSMSRERRADQVWWWLFKSRLPISDSQLGLIEALGALGVTRAALHARDLSQIRRWFAARDPLDHAARVLAIAGLKSVVVERSPFDTAEAKLWRSRKAALPQTFGTIIRVDPIVSGEWGTVRRAALEAGFTGTPGDAHELVIDWITSTRPLYLKAAVPSRFKYGGADKPVAKDWPTATELLDKILLPAARKLKIPLCFEFGAGTDLSALSALCSRNPCVKFVTVVVDRRSQEHVASIARRFRNMHVIAGGQGLGNTTIPSFLSVLHTSFTAQHSGARVLEQLIPAWRRARAAVAKALTTRLRRLVESGWTVTRADVERGARHLLGGAWREYLGRNLTTQEGAPA